MQYIYDVFEDDRGSFSNRRLTTTNWREVIEAVPEGHPYMVEVTFPDKRTIHLFNSDDLDSWSSMLDNQESKRNEYIKRVVISEKEPQYIAVAIPTPAAQHEVIAKAVDPSHYQSYFSGGDLEDLQWLEAKQYEGIFQDPKVFRGAVELQARKYLDRLGGKDNEIQEILKAIWYLRFLAAYIANGNKPIRVKDIEVLLKAAKC